MPLSEFDYIRWIRKQTPLDPARVPIPPGDDMGAFAVPGGEPVLVKIDMIMEGTDFVLPEAGAERVGYKAMAVSLSDVAAMAALPVAAVAASALPNTVDQITQEGLYLGMRRACDRFNCPIIGGDVNAWDGRLVIATTIFARPAGVAPVLRSGAEPGDVVCVTGRLGGSILGRHLDFVPRIAEARALAAAVALHAMIDLSDGLSSDLNHICRESKRGAIVEAAALPLSPAAAELARRDGRPAWEHALNDGEDFELLFTVTEADWNKLRAAPLFDAGVAAVGRITAEPEVRLKMHDGSLRPLPPGGYEHLKR
jgi:thiamine-monophosphate kinase